MVFMVFSITKGFFSLQGLPKERLFLLFASGLAIIPQELFLSMTKQLIWLILNLLRKKEESPSLVYAMPTPMLAKRPSAKKSLIFNSPTQRCIICFPTKKHCF
jgi:hypothetical protein